MIRLGGLVDAHVHLSAPDVSIGVPAALFPKIGVVAVVEGGSYGAEGLHAAASRWRREIPTFVFANVVARGLRDPRESWGAPPDDPRSVFEGAGVKPDGVKVRIGQSPGHDDLADAIKARDAADALGVPLMVHVSGGTCDPDQLFDALRPRDIVTHCYCSPPFSILDGAGKVRKNARSARDRGVMFDLGRSAGRHFDQHVAKSALAQSFPPDFISSDWANQPDGSRGPDLIATMRELLALGMDAAAIVTAVTTAPARFFGFDLPAPTHDSYVELGEDLTLGRVVRDGREL